MQTIRTKWHKVRPLVEANHLYLTAPDGDVVQHIADLEKVGLVGGFTGANQTGVHRLLDQMDKLPHFVIETELIAIAKKKDFQRSLMDMKRAGVCRLPFPAMVVQYQSQYQNQYNRTQFVLLRDIHHKGTFEWEGDNLRASKHMRDMEEGKRLDFYGIRLSLECDANGDYVCMSPSLIFIGLQDKPGPAKIEPKWEGVADDETWVHIAGYNHGLLLDPDNKASDGVVERTHLKDAGPVFHAASAALLLMATAGVEKEVIQTDKINRTRGAGTGKELIPRHTYIRIGHVYASGNSKKAEIYVPHKSPRPHWRRGHIRLQPFGPGRASVKEKYIQPRLIAYRGEYEPIFTDYVVTE